VSDKLHVNVTPQYSSLLYDLRNNNKRNVSNYSANKNVHGLKSNYLIHKLSLSPVVFSTSYQPEGQDQKTENI